MNFVLSSLLAGQEEKVQCGLFYLSKYYRSWSFLQSRFSTWREPATLLRASLELCSMEIMLLSTFLFSSV